jgi:hypothetical protein
MADERQIHARLTIDVTYQSDPDLSESDVRRTLDNLVMYAAGEGLLSGDPCVYVEEYSHDVSTRRSGETDHPRHTEVKSAHADAEDLDPIVQRLLDVGWESWCNAKRNRSCTNIVLGAYENYARLVRQYVDASWS